jgi:hypothetical protein
MTQTKPRFFGRMKAEKATAFIIVDGEQVEAPVRTCTWRIGRRLLSINLIGPA